MNKEGKEVVLELCGGGDFFGYWAVLHEGLHSNSAECLEECKIWLIPADDFKNSLFNNSEISGQFLKALTKNLLIKEHKILDLAYESVRKRVAKALVELQSAYETKGEARMKVSRETIASMAGTSVETAIRMISEFKSDGLIDVQGSEIRVRDPDKLAKLPF
jgi:CRP-like cAMP-binding protein